jgi:hypothetical protein
MESPLALVDVRMVVSHIFFLCCIADSDLKSRPSNWLDNCMYLVPLLCLDMQTDWVETYCCLSDLQVFLVEYFGPLLVHSLVYFGREYVYGKSPEKMHFVQQYGGRHELLATRAFGRPHTWTDCTA